MTGPCDPAPAEPGAFAAAADGHGWTFTGAITFDTATAVLAGAQSLPLPKGGRVDLSGLTAADSSALAVLLALKRRAAHERHPLHFHGLSDSLAALARVYGVQDLVAG